MTGIRRVQPDAEEVRRAEQEWFLRVVLPRSDAAPFFYRLYLDFGDRNLEASTANIWVTVRYCGDSLDASPNQVTGRVGWDLPMRFRTLRPTHAAPANVQVDLLRAGGSPDQNPILRAMEDHSDWSGLDVCIDLREEVGLYTPFHSIRYRPLGKLSAVARLPD